MMWREVCRRAERRQSFILAQTIMGGGRKEKREGGRAHRGGSEVSVFLSPLETFIKKEEEEQHSATDDKSRSETAHPSSRAYTYRNH